jgi:hypothetical protein
MTTIHCQQMIYTRVEAAYSPVQTAGFQTVYCSPGMNAPVVKAIEERVKGYGVLSVISDTPIRRQFFHLESGEVVLTQTQVIPRNAEIVDPFRDGIHLAHCLIFNTQEFELAGNNPLPIFAQFPFVGSGPELIHDYDQHSQRERPGKFDLPTTVPPIDTSGWGIEAIKFVGLAAQTPSLQKQGKSLYAFGSEADIWNMLKLAFHLIPADLRRGCTFDTYILDENVPAGSYWLVGNSQPEYHSDYILVHSSSRSVSQADFQPARDDLYMQWLTENLGRNEQACLSHAPYVQELTRAFRLNLHLPTEFLNETAANSFLKTFHEPILARLSRVMTQNLSPETGQALLDRLLQASLPNLKILDIAASQTISPELYASLLQDWYCDHLADANKLKAEANRLVELGHRIKDPVILFWVGSLVGDKKMRENALKIMPLASYQVALRLLQNPIPVEEYFPYAQIGEFVSATAAGLPVMKNDHWLRLVQTVVKLNGGAYLGPWAFRVFKLDLKGMNELENILKKSKRIDQNFQTAVRQHRMQLGNSRSLFGVFRAGTKPNNKAHSKHATSHEQSTRKDQKR